MPSLLIATRSAWARRRLVAAAPAAGPARPGAATATPAPSPAAAPTPAPTDTAAAEPIKKAAETVNKLRDLLGR